MQTLMDTTQPVPAGYIYTTKGPLPENELDKSVLIDHTPDATVTATEYRFQGELVRRDVNLALKSKNFFEITAQEL